MLDYPEKPCLTGVFGLTHTVTFLRCFASYFGWFLHVLLHAPLQNSNAGKVISRVIQGVNPTLNPVVIRVVNGKVILPPQDTLHEVQGCTVCRAHEVQPCMTCNATLHQVLSRK